eukprot:5045047-Prymnesium_polylepis.1
MIGSASYGPPAPLPQRYHAHSTCGRDVGVAWVAIEPTSACFRAVNVYVHSRESWVVGIEAHLGRRARLVTVHVGDTLLDALGKLHAGLGTLGAQLFRDGAVVEVATAAWLNFREFLSRPRVGALEYVTRYRP